MSAEELIYMTATRSQIDEIVDELSRASGSLETALLRARVLAHKLGSQELKEWLAHELAGYPDNAQIPAFRKVACVVFGNVTNGVYTHNSQTLPTGHLDDELRSQLLYHEVRDAIAVVEKLADEEGAVTFHIAPELFGFFKKTLARDYHVQRAWSKPSMGSILNIVSQVRAKLLELLLQLSDSLPEDPASPINGPVPAMVTDLFKNVVLSGQNVTINVGNGTISNIGNSVSNSFNILRERLTEAGMDSVQIRELESAIEADKSAPEHEHKRLGPRVLQWLKTVGKGGIDVGKGVTTEVISGLIKAYYGFS